MNEAQQARIAYRVPKELEQGQTRNAIMSSLNREDWSLDLLAPLIDSAELGYRNSEEQRKSGRVYGFQEETGAMGMMLGAVIVIGTAVLLTAMLLLQLVWP